MPAANRGRLRGRALIQTQIGRVVSDKMDKTVTGARRAPGQAPALRQGRHALEEISRARREERIQGEGDLVEIEARRKLAKTKAWRREAIDRKRPRSSKIFDLTA